MIHSFHPQPRPLTESWGAGVFSGWPNLFTFPAGTVIPQSGTKIRAMQIIADLEGTPRGPDAGCVDCFSFN